MTRRTVPRVSTLVSLTACLALVAAFAVGVATQPEPARSSEPCGRIQGLVLDGSAVTTTAPLSSISRPVRPIPYRRNPQTTTTTECQP